MPFTMMEKFVEYKWNMVAKPKICLKEHSIFVFGFHSIEDMNLIFERGPWLFQRLNPLILCKWFQGMKLDTQSLQHLLIWVAFPELDLQFWSSKMLSCIANMIGKLYYDDKLTYSKERLSYARVLIEVTVAAPSKIHILFKGPNREEIK